MAAANGSMQQPQDNHEVASPDSNHLWPMPSNNTLAVTSLCQVQHQRFNGQRPFLTHAGGQLEALSTSHLCCACICITKPHHCSFLSCCHDESCMPSCWHTKASNASNLELLAQVDRHSENRSATAHIIQSCYTQQTRRENPLSHRMQCCVIHNILHENCFARCMAS